MRSIPKPIHEQVLKEIEQYDENEAMEEIAKTLWEKKPKLALYFCMRFQIPY